MLMTQMTTDYNNAVNNARTHSDAARRSSEQHTWELGRMQETAIEAAKDTADRITRRNRRNRLKGATAKGVQLL